MKVLIACEESQRVCLAFRKRGHEAYSCDILDSSGGHPEYHVKGDALDILNPYQHGRTFGIWFRTCDGKKHFVQKWDLIIAHPPCTYLSNAGARHLYPKGILNKNRLAHGLLAKAFFMQFLEADCERVCVENPVPSTVFQLPKYTQTIEPYEYGHPFKKKTCLWLKGLPTLKPTNILSKEQRQSTKIAGNWYNKGGKDRQKNRAKTFEGIAEAMAEQWGDYILGRGEEQLSFFGG